MADLISVAEAAAVLGVSQQQVRRLVRAESITGRQVGGRWLVDADAVRDRHREQPAAGRPLSPVMAWVVCALLSEVARPDGSRADLSVADGAGLKSIGDRKLRYRARRALAEAPRIDRVAKWLRNRAHPRRVWVHPGVIDRFVVDARLRAGGSFAYAMHGGDVASAARDVLYVDEQDADAVLGDYRGAFDESGPVLLMVIPDGVPNDLRLAPRVPVSLAVAAVDLLSFSDARSRASAARVLEPALRFLEQAVDRAD